MLAASPAAFAQTVRFVVTCDSRGSDNGVNTAILSEIVQAFLDEEVDFVLFPGDLITGSFNQSTNESQFTNWLSIMQPLYDVGIGVYPCRGNHDVYSPKAAWDNVFTGSYSLPNNGPSGEENVTFSFTYQNVFVVGLDQYVVDGRVNQTWLDAQFANNTEPHIFVFGHEPAFKLVHEDCLDDYPENRDTFWDSIADAGGRAYFAGHDHFYDHSRLDDGDANPDNDLHQYIVGTAGAPLYTDGSYDGNNGIWTPIRIMHEQEYGYVLVEIDGATATLTWKHRTAPNQFEATDDVLQYTLAVDEESSGWILISLFKQPTNTSIDSVLETISGKYISVWAYKGGVWYVYDPANPAFSDLNTMEPGWGYWIKMKDESDEYSLSIIGQNATDPIDLLEGWNLVGYNSSVSQSTGSAIASIIDNVITVWAYIDESWKVYDPENPAFSDLEIMEPGYGYWINTSEACVWSLP